MHKILQFIGRNFYSDCLLYELCKKTKWDIFCELTVLCNTDMVRGKFVLHLWYCFLITLLKKIISATAQIL